MDLWHSNNMKVVLRKFLGIIVFEISEPWTKLIVFFFPCIDYFHMAHSQAK